MLKFSSKKITLILDKSLNWVCWDSKKMVDRTLNCTLIAVSQNLNDSIQIDYGDQYSDTLSLDQSKRKLFIKLDIKLNHNI